MEGTKNNMSIKELIKDKRFSWFNLFIRDMILVFVVAGLQYMTHFNSKVVFMITGMMVVWITWQLADFLNYIKLNQIRKDECR
jgi:hypothetical protein